MTILFSKEAVKKIGVLKANVFRIRSDFTGIDTGFSQKK